MHITILAGITAILLLLRQPTVKWWPLVSRLLLSFFCFWSALMLFPADFPEAIRQWTSLIIICIALAVIVFDLLVFLSGTIVDSIRHHVPIGKTIPPFINEIFQAVTLLAQRRIGATIVLQRKQRLDQAIKESIEHDAGVNAKILMAFFVTASPIHDGAVVIHDGRVKRVKAILPLATQKPVSMGVGTRHRSAIGLTEKTDALVIVVSEERGEISVASRGTLIKIENGKELMRLLTAGVKGKDILKMIQPKQLGL